MQRLESHRTSSRARRTRMRALRRGPSPRSRSRRGVLLLIILSILVLFSVVAVTFALVSSQYRRTSMAMPTRDRYAIDYKSQLDDAAKQLFRGSNNPNSALSIHSLLEDMYGYDGLISSYVGVSIASVSNNTGSTPAQFIDLFLTPTTTPFSSAMSAGYVGNANLSGYFNGCVLTMLSGALAGKSTRIVGYDSGTTSGAAALRVMCFEGTLQGPKAGDLFIINGRAFNGTGAGYNTATMNIDAQDANSHPYALLPNPKFFVNNLSAGGTYNTAGGTGGADEDYDIADFQNMFLAFLTGSVGIPPTAAADILPSFHRPDLIQFWVNKSGAMSWNDTAMTSMNPSATPPQPSLLQQTMLRPFGGGTAVDSNGMLYYTPASGKTIYGDHPYFTGSNPNFDPVNGPWDVDTDGDGLADSVWVDLGSPVQTAPDGTVYKPLYAIMCLDLDGRLNLNAHGNVAQAQTGYTTPPTGPFPGTGTYTTSSTTQLLYGSGFGPADINLAAGSALFTPTTYQTFFTGSSPYESRYGELGTPAPLPGLTTAANSADDLLSLVKHYNYPMNFYSQNPYTEFGQPSDLWGRMAVGIDFRGQPVFAFAGTSLGSAPNETPNNPYALNLSQSRIRNARSIGATDNPFSVAELERILRYPDLDASNLPDRLRALLNLNLVPGNIGAPGVPYIVTTESFDPPIASILPTTEMRAALKSYGSTLLPSTSGNIVGSLGLADLVAAKMSAVNSTATTPTAADLSALLWPEFLSGVRFDVNRPFGNGIDDNGNNVVDEPEEYGVNNEQAWSSAFPSAVQFAHDWDGDGNITSNDAVMARHYYARHLYVLMMLFMDSNYPGWSTPANDAGMTAPLAKELMTRRIAQWAINCVDFRDPDSIMTPFEYDVNPFVKTSPDTSAWAVDGNPNTADTSTDRRVIWGAEYPDLLLTETGAFHDRRARDTANDTGSSAKVQSMPPDATGTLDQIRIPQGSLFVELYCTRNGSNPYYPADLYTNNGGQWGLDLGRMTAANNGSQYPVWRLAILGSTLSSAANNINNRMGNTNPDSTSLDPYYGPYMSSPAADPYHLSVFDPANPIGPVTIERIAWLAAPSGAQIPSASTEDQTKIFYNQNSGAQVLLAPDNYAVVGPRPTTYVGLQNTAPVGVVPAQYSMQDITITPNVSAVPPNGTSTYPNSSTIKTPLGIVCAAPAPTTWVSSAQTAPNGIGLNISEPLPGTGTYYPEPSQLRNPSAAYDPVANPKDSYGQEGNSAFKFPDIPLDSPLSAVAANNPIVIDSLYPTKTTPGYKTILLQRLADPLAAYNPPPPSANYNSNLPINPYVTIDWQPVDLTVFNGEGVITAGVDQYDPSYNPGTPPNNLNFAARQRGNVNIATAATVTATMTPISVNSAPGNLNVWSAVPQAIPTNPVANTLTGSNSVFDYALTNTLGYLNTTYGAPWGTGSTPPVPSNYYLGDPNLSALGGSLVFPWLVWNNRPFASPLEMMTVPASSPSRLTYEFSLGSGTTLSPYDTGSMLPFQIPYRHLLNFFLAGPQATPGAAALGTAPQLYRIFDYLQVPSRFVGTETVLNPTVFTNAVSNATLTGPFFPPFNKVSNFRDPGRVNINTVANSSWFCVINGNVGAPQGGWISNSRMQGYTPGTYPSRFTNPFRSAAGADLSVGSAYMPPRKGVEVGLLRPDPTTATQPLFDFPAPSAGGTAPLYTDPLHSSAFRYQTMNRMANLLTTRSNVYAAWITVGYFQVKPWYGTNGGSPPIPNAASSTNPAPVIVLDPAHPDGWQLGPELGTDTGDIKRHRAFYIFDRSIPVGFQRGEDYNVEDAIRLRRFIE
jgi:hypothetical protein